MVVDVVVVPGWALTTRQLASFGNIIIITTSVTHETHLIPFELLLIRSVVCRSSSQVTHHLIIVLSDLRVAHPPVTTIKNGLCSRASEEWGEGWVLVFGGEARDEICLSGLIL